MKALFIVLALMLFLPVVVADTDIQDLGAFTKGSVIDIKTQCELQGIGVCDYTFDCNITVLYPNGTTMVGFRNMTQIGNIYNYTLPVSTVLGDYENVNIICSNGTLGGSRGYRFSITPTGDRRGFSFMLIIMIAGVLLTGLGIWKGVEFIGFIGGIMLTVSGVYTMVYGFNNITDMYTRAFAMVVTCIGLVVVTMAGWEWVANIGGDE